MNSFKRVLAVILSVVTIMTAVPVSALIVPAADDSYGVVEAITKTSEDNPKITDNGKSEVTVEYKGDLSLNWYPANEVRASDGWWVGIKVTAPTGIDITDSKYLTLYNGFTEWSSVKSFNANKDGDRYIELWGFVSEAVLDKAINDGKELVNEYKFDWNNDADYEQHIVMSIDPAKVTLYKTVDGLDKVVYPVDKYGVVEAITKEPVITDNKTAEITVDYTDTLDLNWYPANAARSSDGWWVGIKVTAPTDIDITDSKYQTLYNGFTEWSSAKSFNANKDGDRHIELWGFVNESVLNNAIANSNKLVNEYKFDWDNDGTYEQHIVMNIDPAKITLHKTVSGSDTIVYPVDSASTGKVTPITDKAQTVVDAANPNLVTVKNTDEVNLQWADDSVPGRAAGWWAGILITAPADVDITKSMYRTLYNGVSGWSGAKSFNANKDGARDIQMWGYVDESVIENAKANGKMIENRYQFDWDGDGVYEQYIIFSIDPNKVTLDYTNLYSADDKAPVFVEKPDDATAWKTNDSITLSGKVADAGNYQSGVKSVEYKRGSDESKAASFDATTGEWSIDIADEFEGKYTITATDNSGKSTSIDIIVKLDNKAPEIVNINIDASDWTNSGINVSGSVSDSLSGVEKAYFVKLDGIKEDDIAALTYTDLDSYSNETVAVTSDSFAFNIAAQNYEGYYALYCEDVAGNKSAIRTFLVKMDNDKCSIISANASDVWTNDKVVVDGSFSDNLSGVASVYYVKGDVTNTVNTIDELVALGAIKLDTITTSDNGKTGAYTFDIAAQNYEGKYTIYAVDKAKNVSDKATVSVAMDTTKPVINSAIAVKDVWTKEDVVISVNAADISMDGVKSDINAVYCIKGNVILTSENIADYDSCKMAPSGSVYTMTITAQNYNGDYSVYAVDNAGNISDASPVGVMMDIVAPTELKVEFEETLITKIIKAITFGLYDSSKDDVIVNVSAVDPVTDGVASGVARFDYTYTSAETGISTTGSVVAGSDGKATFTVAGNEDTVVVTAYDNAGNSIECDSKSNTNIQGAVLDKVAPVQKGEITYDSPIVGSDDKMYFSADAKLTFAIDEEYFFESYENNGVTVKTLENNVEFTITQNGSSYEGAYTSSLDEDNKTISVEIPATADHKNDGVYKVTVKYTDLSGNSLEITSDTFTIDTTKPEVIANYNTSVNSNDGIDYYNKENPVGLELTVKEVNFDVDLFVPSIKATDVCGTDLEAVANYVNDYCKNKANWTTTGDQHVINIPLEDNDANYVIEYTMKDRALNPMDAVASKAVTYDSTDPTVKMTANKAISYKVLEAITFGFYKKTDVTITVTDNTAGIEQVVYKTVGDAAKIEGMKGEISKTLTPADLTITNEAGVQTGVYTFTIDDEFKNQIEATVNDYSKNTVSVKSVNDSEKDIDGIVVDTDEPTIDGITYKTPVTYDDGKMYFGADATLVFDVKEVNFFETVDKADGTKVNAVELTVTKDGEDVSSDYTAVVDEAAKTVTVVVSAPADHTNDGVFKVKLAYTDPVGNECSKETQEFVIDTTKPEVNVKYTADEPQMTEYGRKYYGTKQTVTFTVTERNFDPALVEASISQKDVNGNDITGTINDITGTINVEDVNVYLKKADSWTSNGDVHTATVVLSGDANYDITFNCKDRALNASDEFIDSIAVDENAPNINIAYSTPLWEKILSGITFGIYKESVTVTVTATDVTTPIYSIKYSAAKQAGASDVNTESIGPKTLTYNADDAAEKLTLKTEGNDKDAGYASTSFTIDPNFRGFVTVEATNFSGHTQIVEELSNKHGVIVDNIAPELVKATVKPAEGVSGIVLNTKDNYSFEAASEVSLPANTELIPCYAGKAIVTISINEANFNQQSIAGDDTIIAPDNTSIKVNGNEVCESGYIWTREEGTDIYTTEITLSGNGKYVVEVNCTDMSGNAMNNYTSQDIIIDTYAPSVDDFIIDSSVEYRYQNEFTDKSTEQSPVTDAENDKNRYDYYSEKDFNVTVKAIDNVGNKESATGIKDIILIAENVDKKTSTIVTAVSGKLNEDNSTPRASKTFTVKGPFKGNLYAIAIDKLGQYPTDSEVSWTTEKEEGREYRVINNLLGSVSDSRIDENALLVAPNDSVIEDSEQHYKTSNISIRPEVASEIFEYDGDKNINIDFINEKITEKVTDEDGKELSKKIQRDKYSNFIIPGFDASSKNAHATKVQLFGENTVMDLVVTDKYSGIAQIEWFVAGRKEHDSKNDKSGKIVIDNPTGTISSNTSKDVTWTLEKEDKTNLVTRASAKVKVTNNSNDIIVLVILTDNAGNKSYDFKVIGIDKTKPVVKVTYSDNNVPTGNYSNYYNEERQATISVTDRNFRAEDIKATIKNIDKDLDGNNDETKNIPNISKITKYDEWTHHSDPVARTHTFVINYATGKDGTFIYSATYADALGNETDKLTEGKFTMDFTAPTMTVDLGNDKAANKIYFKENRTATITVSEHIYGNKFNEKEAINNTKSSLNNADTTAKTTDRNLSNFKSAGKDKYSATVSYSVDSDYKLDFEYTDKAGNKVKNVEFKGDAAKEFTIDKTKPVINVNANGKNLVTKTAFREYPLVSIDVTDNNCDSISSEFVKDYWDTNNGELVTVSVVGGSTWGASTSNDHQTKLRAEHKFTDDNCDGYYIIRNVTVKDKAGNVNTVSTVEFTTNKYGSVFKPSDDLKNIINKGYINSNDLMGKNLSFDEFSPVPTDADKDKDFYITINGKKYEGYITAKSSMESNWFKRTYTINNDMFTYDGEYGIYVKPRATYGDDEITYNDTKAKDDNRLAVKFVYDNTNPYVRIDGLDDHAAYEDEKTVTLYASDANLKLIKVIVDGKETTWCYNSDEINGALAFEYDEDDASVVKASFTISGSDINIEIIVEDMAGNVACSADDYNKADLFTDLLKSEREKYITETSSDKDGKKIVLTKIAVTTNTFEYVIQILKDNTPITIGVAVALAIIVAASIIIPVTRKRRKKLDEADEKEID